MKKWEYKFAEPGLASMGASGINTGTVEELNAYGAEGWELVAMLRGLLVFKRQLPDIVSPPIDADTVTGVAMPMPDCSWCKGPCRGGHPYD